MRKWWPLVAICLGSFMLLLDVTIVNVALPKMASDLHASFSSLQWVVDAYSLALAAVLLVLGSLADLYGHRRLYLIGLTVFALASLSCALAPNPATLVTARAVQGLGGAAMFATSAALLGKTYHGRDRGTAFGFWGAVNGAGAAAGPVLGGLLTQGLGWPAIFLVNVPIAAVTVVLTLRVVRKDQSHQSHRPHPAAAPAGAPAAVAGVPAAALQAVRRGPGIGAVDLPGALAFTVCAGFLTFGLIRGGESGWTTGPTLAGFVVAVVALAVFVGLERRSARPMLDLALLRTPSFAGLMLGAVLIQGAAFGSLVLVSIWLQSVLGLSPIPGGLALTPLAVLSFATSAVAGRFLQRIPARFPIGIGALLVALGTFLLSRSVGTGSHQSALYAGLMVIGVGIGFATPVLMSAAMGSVPPQRMGMAGGAVNTARQLGLTLGIAVFAAVFAGRAQTVLAGAGFVPDPQRAASALGSGQAARLVAAAPAARRSAAETVAHHAFASGLDTVFLVSACAAAVAGLLVLVLVRPRTAMPAGVPAARAEGSAPEPSEVPAADSSPPLVAAPLASAASGASAGDSPASVNGGESQRD